MCVSKQLVTFDCFVVADILPNGGCRFSQEQPQKTLSVEIRLHRDCDSRWVADSVLEVNMEP